MALRHFAELLKLNPLTADAFCDTLLRSWVTHSLSSILLEVDHAQAYLSNFSTIWGDLGAIGPVNRPRRGNRSDGSRRAKYQNYPARRGAQHHPQRRDYERRRL